MFRSVVDLQAAINHFVAETNADPKPFVWTADPKRVLAAVKRGKQALEFDPLGPTDGDSVSVKGIAEYDRVIIGNLQKIGPGSPVSPIAHKDASASDVK